MAIAVLRQGPMQAFAHESITVDNTAGGKALTAGTYQPTTLPNPGAAELASITAEDNQMRFTLDGTTVSTTVGHLLDVGDALEVVGFVNIQNFRAIRTGGSSGVIKVTYFR